MSTVQFSGTYTALVTPMCNGSVSFKDFENLIEYQISDGIDGIVVVGTTGESPTLSHQEHCDIVSFSIDKVAGRIPVIAGTGSNSTKEAVSLTQHAHEAGVDGMLQVAPYYNKPSQEGLISHFSAVAEVTDKPIVLYSIPSRCGIEIGVKTVERLRSLYPNINVIKEAGGSCDRVSELVSSMGEDITVLSGDDSLTLPFISAGAKGVISVASNLIVKDLVNMCRSALNGDLKPATQIHLRYFDLFRTIFIEPNPVPIKAALENAKIILSREVRLPLCEMTQDNSRRLQQVLDNLEISSN